jgi:hypothetical protein
MPTFRGLAALDLGLPLDVSGAKGRSGPFVTVRSISTEAHLVRSAVIRAKRSERLF